MKGSPTPYKINPQKIINSLVGTWCLEDIVQEIVEVEALKRQFAHEIGFGLIEMGHICKRFAN